ncbi:hypothetical protein BH23GEM7_BH23GEM7_01620 [soil metagenome]
METSSYSITGRHAELAPDEIEDLKRGTWFVDCPHLELRPRSGSSLVFRGPGALQQDEDGQIAYKIYVESSVNSERLRDDGYGPAGTIIPETAYFDLTAVDMKGREWRSNRILLESRRSGPSGGPVVGGSVEEISCEGELPASISAAGSSLSFTIFDKIKIPTNAHTSEHRYIAGWSRSRNFGVDAWRFRAVGMSFLLSNDRKDRLQVHVASNEVELPRYFDTRVLESLFFILGRPLVPTITRRREGHRTACTLHSRHREATAARYPPLGIRHFQHPKTGKSTAEPYRRLFARYLAHVLSCERKHHPLWGQLHAVYEASAGAFVDSEALTLTVAIESILGSEFPDVGKPSASDLVRIDEALAYWNARTGDPELKERIKGSIGQYKQSRAGDKLRVLAQEGAITAGTAKSWQKLRNANTHAYQRHSLEPDEFRRLLDQARMLFFQLIFATIGYRGLYRDYSKIGWPLRQYPSTSSDIGE